jgi:hypothetical protein
MGHNASRIALVLAALGLTGCIGNIGGQEVASEDAAPAADVATMPMRRLTPREVARTVRDALGVDITDVTDSFPVDGYVDGFDNDVSVQSMTQSHARHFLEAAEAAAERLLADPASAATTLSCDPAELAGEACHRAIAERLGRRLFRRPLAEAEVASLLDLAASVPTDTDPLAPTRAVLEALLVSPQYLFRIERGEPVDGRPEVRRLTGYEVATRLSFTLWESGPDDALLDAAARGDLDTRDGIRQVATGMIDHPNAREARRIFVSQWLELHRLDEARFDEALFPAYSDGLRDAAREEVLMLADEHLGVDGASALGIFDANAVYVDASLAALYGVQDPPAAGQERRAADGLVDRGGLFTTAAFLMLTSDFRTTSIVQRGKFVREVALCDPPPEPPPGVEMAVLEPGTEAEALMAHAADPACSGCHQRLDPIGLGLDHFDAIGGARDGRAVGQGEVIGLDPPGFTGGVGLGRAVRAAPDAAACAAKKYLKFALGRVLVPEDAEPLAAVVDAFDASGGSFRELVLSTVESDAFRFRKVAP